MYCSGGRMERTIVTMHALVASASPLVRRYTLDEFFALEPPPDGGHYELIAGVLYMVPPPTGPHHLVASDGRLCPVCRSSSRALRHLRAADADLDAGRHLPGARPVP